jgi:hypothetical protein
VGTSTGETGAPAGTCFKVDPGNGFVVVTNGPASFPVYGVATTTPITLSQAGASNPTGVNVFSPSLYSTAGDAKSLMDDIGSVNVAWVARYLPSADVLQEYTGRKTQPSTFFPLPQMIWVKMLTTVNYVPTTGNTPPNVCSVSPSTYYLNGTANTDKFAFAIKDGSGNLKCWNNCAPLNVGGGAVQIATDVGGAVNMVSPPSPAVSCSGMFSASVSGSAVTISGLGGNTVQNLLVSDAAPTCPTQGATPVANCQVPLTNTCTFNPTISLVSPTPPSSVPALGPWALVSLAVVIVGIGAMLLRYQQG